MERVQTKGKRTIKGKPHYVYLLNDNEIAKVAHISNGALVIARFRGMIETFEDLVDFVVMERHLFNCKKSRRRRDEETKKTGASVCKNYERLPDTKAFYRNLKANDRQADRKF